MAVTGTLSNRDLESQWVGHISGNKGIKLAGFFDLSARVLRQLEPETAHNLAIRALKIGLARPSGQEIPVSLATQALGLKFSSPLGLAAGYDKNAEVADRFLQFGFGFVEVGTITLRPPVREPKAPIVSLKKP